MRGREPRRSMRHNRESVYRAHVALMCEICEVHGHVPCRPPAATCEARTAMSEQQTSLNIEMLSFILTTHRKNPYSEVTVKENPKCELTRRTASISISNFLKHKRGRENQDGPTPVGYRHCRKIRPPRCRRSRRNLKTMETSTRFRQRGPPSTRTT
ncbi:hypothetical protein EVAR_24991_1 [Eumeta japonica]|uniref:Uncharacterized protein n=1 Tax=Eumeta variegata TaxID=151549 RepID=A0A4C1XG74_EUMVA|nr:hypothetical protein EVAR_24991_1 [Eumeta japonica]